MYMYTCSCWQELSLCMMSTTCAYMLLIFIRNIFSTTSSTSAVVDQEWKAIYSCSCRVFHQRTDCCLNQQLLVSAQSWCDYVLLLKTASLSLLRTCTLLILLRNCQLMGLLSSQGLIRCPLFTETSTEATTDADLRLVENHYPASPSNVISSAPVAIPSNPPTPSAPPLPDRVTPSSLPQVGYFKLFIWRILHVCIVLQARVRTGP